MEKNTNTKNIALGCYHGDGMIPSFNLAKSFAGTNGRVATALDIVDARLSSDMNTFEWGRYFTTLSAEYVGKGKDGKMKLIVAHGIGPLSTIEGIKKAYSHSYNDKNRNIEGGRITCEEFLKLENGDYGEVTIVDFDKYLKSKKYPFMEILEEETEEDDPVLQARLGPKYKDYIKKARSFFYEWSQIPNTGKYHNRKIICIESGDIYYSSDDLDIIIKPNLAFANLISIDNLTSVSESGTLGQSLIHNLDLQSWTNGTRFVGINCEGKISKINRDFSYMKAIKNENTLKLLQVKKQKVLPNNILFSLIKIEEKIFTQIPKKGISLDTHAPEFEVNSLDIIGNPIIITIDTAGYPGFLKYDLMSVKAIAPKEANCYELLNYGNINSEQQFIEVQFYNAQIDFTKRLLTEKEVYKDFNLMKKILNL